MSSPRDIARQLGLDDATGIIRTVTDSTGSALDGRNPKYGLPWTPAPKLWYSSGDALPNPATTPVHQSTDGLITSRQADTVNRATHLLDERRGIPFTAGAEDRHHQYSVIQKESKELTTVYVWSQPGVWAKDSDVARVVMDGDGRLHQLHHGLVDAFGAVWVDLDAA